MGNRTSSQKGPSQRQRRAGELIRHVVAELLQRGEIHDAQMPLAPITITEVTTSPDLRHATVYCAVLGSDEATAEIEALNQVAGKIRAALGRKIAMKYTPALTFKRDMSFAEAARIEALLNREDVKRDL